MVDPSRTSPDDVRLIRRAEAARALLAPIRARILRALDRPDSAAGVARRLRLPRQKVNYHLRELEKLGLLELFEERRAGNCVERRVQAVARTFVLAPQVLGALGRGSDPGEDSAGTAGAARAARAATRVLEDLASGGTSAESAEGTVRFASDADEARFVAELKEAVAALIERHGTPEGTERRVTVILNEPRSSAGRLPEPRALDG